MWAKKGAYFHFIVKAKLYNMSTEVVLSNALTITTSSTQAVRNEYKLHLQQPKS